MLPQTHMHKLYSVIGSYYSQNLDFVIEVFLKYMYFSISYFPVLLDKFAETSPKKNSGFITPLFHFINPPIKCILQLSWFKIIDDDWCVWSILLNIKIFILILERYFPSLNSLFISYSHYFK